MNILLIASSSGTLSYHLSRLSIALKRNGYDVTVLSGPKEQVKGLSTELAEAGIGHFTSKFIDKIRFYSICKGKEEILKILKIKDIDIIHANGATHALHAYLGVRSFSSIKRPAIVTSVHSFPRDKFLRKPKLIAMTTILNKCSDVILPVSNYTKKQLIMHGLNSQKTITIHNAIDLSVFDYASRTAHVNLKRDQNKPNIVYAANLVPVKGHKYYLMAAAKVLRECKALFYVIGDGSLREYLRRLAYRLGIEKNVVFTGRIHWPEIYYVLSNIADICVSSSLSENFPFYIIECMAARKPIIATDVGGVSEAIIDGVNGYLIPPRDSVSLAKAILKLIKDPYKAAELGLKGRQIVEKQFSMDVIIQKIKRIYESTLRR